WAGVILNEDNKTQFWIPPGLAHGFAVLSDTADFEYKCTDFYNPKAEGCLIWNDPAVGIDWPLQNPLLSTKDQQGKTLEELFK
ncbi:dTDP-4-dehydrorhamnose 3,5-epimerase family protein, partial [Neisseria dentiae]